MTTITGIILDVKNKTQFHGELTVESGKITSVREKGGEDTPSRYILPGFVDSHMHIESSMLTPSQFARIAIRHGTVATVSDPHEIANVCGTEGMEFMLADARKVPLKFSFGVPSCVPATPFETSGATLDAQKVRELLGREDFLYLGEMMNWPGVLDGDKEVMAKIRASLAQNKPVDGHAPGLNGEAAQKYISAGISTDHECYSLKEALDKLEYGMKILIREGSAARNFDELLPALELHPGKIMFCSDDKHPDDLIQGHINQLAARATSLGYDLLDTLQACSVTPVEHYGLDVGLLQEGDPADFTILENLNKMEISETWIKGERVFDGTKVHIPEINTPAVNNFAFRTLCPEDFHLKAQNEKFPVIEAEEGSLLTGKSYLPLEKKGENLQPDAEKDILKITVVNRYKIADPAVGFVRGFGLREGAIGSSVAHDSHNVVAVGTSDHYLSRAVNLIMDSRGGITTVDKSEEAVLPLPVGGIISDRPGEEVARTYEYLTRKAKEMGSFLQAPHMLLSFMALLVIPSLKISDAGIFDADKFQFIA